MAISASLSVFSGTYCNIILQSRSVCCRRFLSEWTTDILRFRGISPPEETQVYQNAEQDCARCGDPGSSCGSGLTDLYSASTGIGRRFRSSWDSTPSVRLSRSRAWLLETPRLCYNSIVI